MTGRIVSTDLCTVKLDGRIFIVGFHNGQAMSIKERKIYAEGRPYESLYNSSYWHHSMRQGGKNAMPRRIIAAARLKREGI